MATSLTRRAAGRATRCRERDEDQGRLAVGGPRAGISGNQCPSSACPVGPGASQPSCLEALCTSHLLASWESSRRFFKSPEQLHRLRAAIRGRYLVSPCDGWDAVRRLCDTEAVSLAVLDLYVDGSMDLDPVRQLRRLYPRLVTVAYVTLRPDRITGRRSTSVAPAWTG